LSKLGPGRFLETYLKILKLYVLKLRIEAEIAIEKGTVKVIKSWGNCRFIAQRIVTLITPDYEENVNPLDELVQH
jgi:hypothetical protein